MLHHAHFVNMGGFQTFAAVSSNGGCAQIATFAKSGLLYALMKCKRPIVEFIALCREVPVKAHAGTYNNCQLSD